MIWGPKGYILSPLNILRGLRAPLFLKHCGIGHLKKNRLLPDLKLLQNVPQHSLFKLCRFHEKINGQFFARGQNVLYDTQVLRL